MSAPKVGHFSNKSFNDLEREYKARRAAFRTTPAPSAVSISQPSASLSTHASTSASLRLLALASGTTRGTPPLVSSLNPKPSVPRPPPPPPPLPPTISVVSSSSISSPSNSSLSGTKSMSVNRSATPSATSVPSTFAVHASSHQPRIVGATSASSASRPRSVSLTVPSTSAVRATGGANANTSPPFGRASSPRISNTKATPIDLTSSTSSSSSQNSNKSSGTAKANLGNKAIQTNGIHHSSTTNTSTGLTTSSLFASSNRANTPKTGATSSQNAFPQGQTPVDRARAAAAVAQHRHVSEAQKKAQPQHVAALRAVPEPLQNLFSYATVTLGDYARRRPYERLKNLPEYPKPPVELEAFDGSENCRQWLNHAKKQWKKVDANRYKRNPAKKRVEVVVRRKKRKSTDGASSDSDGEDVLSSLAKKSKLNGVFGVAGSGTGKHPKPIGFGKGPSPKKRKKLVPAKKPRFFTTRALDRLNREYVPISEALEDDSKLRGGTFDFLDFRIARLPLVAKEFGLPPKHVGDLLLISDFLLAYQDLLRFDTKLRCIDLACEISELTASVIVQDMIIAFLRVLIPPLFESEGRDPKHHPITYLTWPNYLAKYMRHEMKLTERKREQELRRLASLPKDARARQEEAGDVFRDWCFNARHVRETEGGRFFLLDYQSRLKTILRLLDATISSEDIRLDLFASAGDLNKAHGEIEKFGRSLVAQLKEELNSKEDALFATSRALGTALGKMDAEIAARATSRQKDEQVMPPVAVPSVAVHQTDASGFKVPNLPSTPSAPSSSATFGASGDKGGNKVDPACSSASSSSSTASSSSLSSSPSSSALSAKASEQYSQEVTVRSEKKSVENPTKTKSSESGAEQKPAAPNTSTEVTSSSGTRSDKSPKSPSTPSASNASTAPKPKAPKTPVVNEERVREWQEFASDAYIVSKLRAIEREKMKKEFALNDTQASGAVSREPLGYDRFRRVYWRVRGCQDTAFIQISSDAKNAMFAAGSASQTAEDGSSEWRCVRTRTQFNSLCDALNPEGSREHKLLNALQCYTWTFSNIRRKSIRLHSSRKQDKGESGGKDIDESFRMYPRYVTKREMRGARAMLDANTDYAWKKSASEKEKEKASTNATSSCDSSVSTASSVESSSANADAKSLTNDADDGEMSAEQRQLQGIDKLRKQLEFLAHKRAHKKGLSELNCLKLLLLDMRRYLHTRSVASSSLPSLERLLVLLKRESSRTDEPPSQYDLSSPWVALDSVRTAMSILLSEISEKWTCPWFNRQEWYTQLADARHIHEVATLLFDLDKAIIYSPNSYRTIHAKHNKMKAAAQDEKKDEDDSLVSPGQTRPDRCQVCQLDVALKRDHVIMCFECDREWHMGCLDPLLHFVPEEPWHCSKCSAALKKPEGEKSAAAAFGPKVAQIVASFEHKSTSSEDEHKSTSSSSSDHQTEVPAKDTATESLQKKSAASTFSGWSFELQRLEKCLRAQKKHLDMQLRKRARKSDSVAARSKKRKFSALSTHTDSENASRSATELSDSDNDASTTNSDEKTSSKSVIENAVAEFLRSSLNDPEHPRNVKRCLLLSAKELSKAQIFRASPRSHASTRAAEPSTTSAISRSSSFRASDSSVRCTGGQPSRPLSFFENDAHLACCLVCSRPLIPLDSTSQFSPPRLSPSAASSSSSLSSTSVTDEKQSQAGNSTESKSSEVNTSGNVSRAERSNSHTPPDAPESEPFLRCTATGCNDGVSFPTAVHKSCYYEFRPEWRLLSASKSVLSRAELGNIAQSNRLSSSSKMPPNRFYDNLQDDPLIVLGEKLKRASEGGDELNAELAWRCDQCRRHTDHVRCELCHHSKGIFQQVEPRKSTQPSLACVDAKMRHWNIADFLPKPGDRHKWVHRVCALWHPNLSLERQTSYLGESREFVCGLDGVRQEEPLPGACEFCCRSDGFRLNCSHPGCTKSHHVMCLVLVGVHSGCFIEERISGDAAAGKPPSESDNHAIAQAQAHAPEDADVKMAADCEDADRSTSNGDHRPIQDPIKQSASQKKDKGVSSSFPSDKGSMIGKGAATQNTGVNSHRNAGGLVVSDGHSAVHMDSKEEDEKAQVSKHMDTSKDSPSGHESKHDIDMPDAAEVSLLSPSSIDGVFSRSCKISQMKRAESVPVRRSWCCEHGPLRAAARASS